MEHLVAVAAAGSPSHDEGLTLKLSCHREDCAVEAMNPTEAPLRAASAARGIEAFEPVRNCWYLTGATASGKTGIGLELAERVNAEIISLDSMAIYIGMDLGTAKPSPADRQRVPHHMLDLVAPSEQFSLSQYVAGAHRAIDEIRQRGREVLFVGGTPLYLKALLRGVYPGPPADWEFRQQIEAELRSVGVEALHQRLQQVDPLAAAKLHPHDKRRIIRALEVCRQTGRPLSHEQIQFEACPPGECRAFALQWPRAELHRRIEVRVERMFRDGLVDEVDLLLKRYGNLSRTAAQAVGYREVLQHLRGEQDRQETIASVKARTRQFARRQETWFRSLPECQRIELDSAVSAAEVADSIVQLGGQACS
jgi:tRNA dimethylallyltransferase